MAKFLSGPTGKHGTQKIRKHVLKRGITRDMNAAAGALVNTKNPNSMEAFRYGTSAKGIGPRFGKTKSPPKPRFKKRR
mgnify:CR=1 FL=1